MASVQKLLGLLTEQDMRISNIAAQISSTSESIKPISAGGFDSSTGIGHVVQLCSDAAGSMDQAIVTLRNASKGINDLARELRR